MAKNLIVEKRDLNSACDFVFDGDLLPPVRSYLVTELVKYLLYERQQIPLPFQNIQQELERIGGSNDEDRQTKKPRFYSISELRKSVEVVKNMEDISSKLLQSFEVCPEIRQILVVLGGTPISAKETYLINFPPLQSYNNSLSFKTCSKFIFRKLIMHDFLGKMNPVSLTNLILLINAPRDSKLQTLRWFLPKPSYKIPRRMKQFVFNFVSKSSTEESVDQSLEAKDLDISGVTPFESFDIGISMNDETCTVDVVSRCDRRSTVDSGLSSLLCSDDKSSESNCTDSENSFKTLQVVENGDEVIHSHTEQEYIWFQAPVVIKGYRDTSSKQATSDMFL